MASEACPFCGNAHDDSRPPAPGWAWECWQRVVKQRDALRAACAAMLSSMDYADDDRPLMKAVRAALALCPKAEGAEHGRRHRHGTSGKQHRHHNRARLRALRQRDDLLSALQRVLRWAIRSERGMREEPIPDEEMSTGLLVDVQYARRAIANVEKT